MPHPQRPSGDPAQARQRGLALQDKVREQHSLEAFGANAPALSGFFRPIRGRAG